MKQQAVLGPYDLVFWLMTEIDNSLGFQYFTACVRICQSSVSAVAVAVPVLA